MVNCNKEKQSIKVTLMLRDKQNEMANDFRLLIWKNKMLKFQDNI